MGQELIPSFSLELSLFFFSSWFISGITLYTVNCVVQ